MAKNNNVIHVPMNSMSEIETVRNTLKGVLSPMGYKYTVRGRTNAEVGDYASVSIQSSKSCSSGKSCASRKKSTSRSRSRKSN